MCGVAGFLQLDRAIGVAEAVSRLRLMTDRLSHRGPDSVDVRLIEGASYLAALGHRRLAIVDLSDAGAQPMISSDGRFTIVYNGEVYALDALRQALLDDGYLFRGHSDTEVMLEYIARWGVEHTLTLLEGMFAFALWDEREKTLTLARDRAGIKPLYWLQREGVLGFASELKAFTPLWRDGRPPINRQAQLLYAQTGYIPAPYTIYENVHKLQPGHFLRIRVGDVDPVIRPYWSWHDADDTLLSGNLVDQAHDILSESVRITLDADVPVGCFLSGGIDSSLVTALMQSHVTRPVKTFAIGFTQEAFDEAPYARAVAAHLGTDHTELIVSEADMLNIVPIMDDIYDEPFSDSSQIPTYLVSKLAREQVSVSLSGDGGDELFLGYGRYQKALQAASVAAYVPRFLRGALRNSMSGLRPFIGGPTRVSSYARLLASPDFGDLYNNFLTYDAPLRARDERALVTLVRGLYDPLPMKSSLMDKARLMRHADFHRYMVDDVLTKVDRASMRVSLESRVPLLNNRVIDLALQLPVSTMMNNQKGKLILRDVLARYVPRPLFERPKMGFGVPMAAWIRGPLKDMVIARIEVALQDDMAPFDSLRTRRALQEHLSGKRDHSYILWLIATYGGWKGRQGA